MMLEKEKNDSVKINNSAVSTTDLLWCLRLIAMSSDIPIEDSSKALELIDQLDEILN